MAKGKKRKTERFKARSRVQAQVLSVQSKTGISVSETLALKVGAYWACVKLISDLVASLPIFLYQKTTEGRKAVKDNTLYYLMHDKPNADMAAYEFKNYVARSICIAGNFYGLKDYDGIETVGILQLVPDRVTPYYLYGDKLYDYQNPITGVKETYTDEEILHIPGFGYDGLKGYTPISYMRDSIGIALSVSESSADAFQGAGQFQGAITYKMPLKEPQKDELRESIPANRTDPLRNILILDGDPSFQNFRISPADLQMIESERFSVEDICRWFGVPPHMVGHSNVTTWGSGIEEQTLGFLTYTLQPSYLSRIEQALNVRLIPEDLQGEYYFEFKRDALLATSLQAQAQYFSTFLQNGVMSRNEVRETKNMPPIPGGDEYTVQSNMMALEMLRGLLNANSN